MTPIRIEASSTERTQRVYARVAGFLFLWLIITGLAGMLTISHIVGSATFAETAKRVAASERLYRVALSSELIETLSALLLAFALYVVLKPIDKLLAEFAMYWRLGESFIGGVGMIFGFVRLRLYTAFGVFASVIVTIVCFGTLIFPEHAATLQYGWAPMAIAEVTTGFWLMLFAVKTQTRSDQESVRSAVVRG